MGMEGIGMERNGKERSTEARSVLAGNGEERQGLVFLGISMRWLEKSSF